MPNITDLQLNLKTETTRSLVIHISVITRSLRGLHVRFVSVFVFVFMTGASIQAKSFHPRKPGSDPRCPVSVASQLGMFTR